MCKKALGVFLAGTSFLFASCVDDTYDLANKEIAMDMQMKGNKISLPLGSLSPFVLDSLLDLESVSMIKADSNRCYSLSLDSNLVTRVAQKDLSVLEDVASLSADIDPVAIEIKEIKIDPLKEYRTEELSFADITIDDVSLEEIEEKVELKIGEIELKPIPVSEQSHTTKFEVPTVEVTKVPIGGQEPQDVKFSIKDIAVTSAETKGIENTLNVEMPEIPMDNYSKPALTTAQENTLSISYNGIDLTNQDDNITLPSIIYMASVPVNVEQGMNNKEVGVKFSFTLPKQIGSFNKVVLKNSDNSGKGALIDFTIVNPTLLQGIDKRTVSFDIHFPQNYVLATYDNNYTLSEKNGETVLSVTDLDASSDETHIRFYMKEIIDLNDSKYYQQVGNKRELVIDEKVIFNVTYKAQGSFSIPRTITTYGQVKQGLTYSMALNSQFDIEEVYGNINAVESTLETKELDFSFDIADLDYIKQIDKVVLDPEKSKLRFSTNISKDLGGFDIYSSTSKIILDLPEQYVFADPIKLPDGVTRVAGTNNFEISSISAFKNGEWEFPVEQVNIDTKVVDGNMNFSAKAYLKAVSGGKEGTLTIKPMENLALLNATEMLCESRDIKFKADPTTLVVKDVTGATNPIGIDLASEEFEMDFTIKDLEYIKSIDFVQFKDRQKISITSTSDNNFGSIKFDEGSYIALCFPEEFEFDYDNCSLEYDTKAKGFIIDNLETLNNGTWTLAINKININKEVSDDKTLSLSTSIAMKAVNAKGEKDRLYIAGINDFSLDKMREDGLFEKCKITFTVQETDIEVAEIEGATENINVEFAGETVKYDIDVKDLKYINYIGSIELLSGSNFLKFTSNLQKDLGGFDLASGSYIELAFPKEFNLDPNACVVPNGIEVTKNSIKVKSLKVLNSASEWKLAVKSIDLNEYISTSIQKSYSIDVVAHDANGNVDSLTIAAIDPFRLTDVVKAGGENSMTFNILATNIEIKDIEASIGEMDFDFEAKTFEFPVSIPNLDKVNEVKYISFKNDSNKIALNINLDGTSIAPFKLADKSVVKIAFPKEFVFDRDNSNFGNLEYDKNDNALYIKDISDIANCQLVLALDRLQMDLKIDEEGTLDWNGVIKVAALNTDDNTEGKIYIAGMENVKYSQISDALSDKTLTFDIPAVEFGIEEAVIISNAIKTEIAQEVELKINQVVPAAIDRVDRLGFTQSVPLTLKLTAQGLDKLNANVDLDMDIAMPSVFDITSDDKRITISDKGINFDISHNFSTSNTIELQLWVNSIDFTTLKDGYLALQPSASGKKDERQLIYEDMVKIEGLASISSAELSSDLLKEDIAMDIAFEMSEITLKNFVGIYGGVIDPVSSSFDLDLKSGFEELEKNGLTLANTKPELMITLYNTIGVPVDVDLAIIGLDENGKEIPTAVIKPEETLRIRPAKFNDKNELVADTTRWLFTSNKDAFVPGYDVVVVKNLDNLLEELPHSISFALTPTIVTKENGEDVLHYVDLTKPLELGGSYSISVPFDLQFAQTIPLEFGEEADAIIRNKENKLSLANPQLALSIYNPIAQELAFDLSLIGKDAEGNATATLFENEPFVLKAGVRNETDGTITPTATRWLFAVNDSIKREDYVTKVTKALGTLLADVPHKIDIALNAHFNTDLVKQIDYNHDLELLCEYGVLVPLQFNDLQLSYADTIADIQLNLEETLDELGLSISNVELALAMNLKNTLPVGLALDLIPLDAKGNEIKGIEIGSIELPAGNGSDISSASNLEGTPVELSIKCASPEALSALDKVSFNLKVISGNGDNALSGKQGLQICNIVLQVMCDVEIDLGK